MHIKIYFNSKPLYLTDHIEDEIAQLIHHDDAVYIDELSTPGINSMIHEMRQPKVHAGIYLHANLQELFDAFRKKFTLIVAAGGLVENESGELLLIFRKGKWDLPKGKADPGETPEECALREVEEETGLKNIQLGTPLQTTYHVYDESGHHILKETFWYRMKVTGDQHPVPQLEEQITALEWAVPGDMKKYLQNTFPLISDLLKEAGVC